jgi:hypothetical protein
MPPRTATTRPHREQGPLARLVERGPYFTDRVRLFRLAGTVRGSSGPRLVQLEDCRTLEVSGYTEEEAIVLGLEPVAAAAQEAGGQPPRGTARTAAGLERTNPEETPPSSTRRTGP